MWWRSRSNEGGEKSFDLVIGIRPYPGDYRLYRGVLHSHSIRRANKYSPHRSVTFVKQFRRALNSVSRASVTGIERWYGPLAELHLSVSGKLAALTRTRSAYRGAMCCRSSTRMICDVFRVGFAQWNSVLWTSIRLFSRSFVSDFVPTSSNSIGLFLITFWDFRTLCARELGARPLSSLSGYTIAVVILDSCCFVGV